MKSRRVLFFALAIALGIGAGLAFGWLIMPPKAPSNAAMRHLRVDYQTDLVLMVAESFAGDANSELALDQLAEIAKMDPITLVGVSLGYAREVGYQNNDIQLIENLLTGIDPNVYQVWKQKSGGQ